MEEDSMLAAEELDTAAEELTAREPMELPGICCCCCGCGATEDIEYMTVCGC